jgi:hypothetical protein
MIQRHCQLDEFHTRVSFQINSESSIFPMECLSYMNGT